MVMAHKKTTIYDLVNQLILELETIQRLSLRVIDDPDDLSTLIMYMDLLLNDFEASIINNINLKDLLSSATLDRMEVNQHDK